MTQKASKQTKPTEMIIKTEIWFFENFNNIDKSLERLTMGNKQKE